LSYYRDKEDNFPSNTTSNSLFNPLLDAQVVGDQNPGDRNIRGLADLPNFRDTGSRQGSGGEIEINWNPTKALRFTANYAQPKVKLSNQNPDTLAYISANLPTFKQIVLDSGGLVDSNNLASVDQSIPVNQQSPGVNNAVNTYNSIIQFQRSYGSGGPPQITDSQRSLNFFGDYTFQTTILKGIRIGAGIQWRGRVTAGTRANDTIVNPANPATAIALPNGASQYVYIPSFQTVHATLAYTWRLKDRRELQANLVVNNLLDSERPTYLGTVLRPRGGDYTSPAREAVLGSTFAFHAQPINYSLMLSLKL